MTTAGRSRQTRDLFRRSKQALLISILVLIAAGSTLAEIKLTHSPMWFAVDGQYPAGCAWTDIDGDGWKDLFVTYGVDGAYVPNKLFKNVEGELETSLEWWSSDSKPSGNPYVGDVDNDGDPDIAVANLGYRPGGFPWLPSVVYYSDDGLQRAPGWSGQDANAFCPVLGDPDGDGDLDLAIAQGNFGSTSPQFSVMYTNNGGTFEESPSWQTDSVYYAVDLAFSDVDLDGDLDLIITGKTMGLAVFYNNAGVIETSPSFQTYETVGGRSLAIGDVDGDGYPDIALARVGWPTFTGGEFQLFMNLGGTFETIPSWTCNTHIEPSAVVFGDLDNDGDLDLVGGSWYNALGVFENVGGTLSAEFTWQYHKSSGFGVQGLALADYDEDALVNDSETFPGDGTTKLIKLDHQPIHEILSVEIDGTPVPLSDYCYDLVEGWISFASPWAAGSSLTIEYSWSTDLDLAVTCSERVSVFENCLVDDPDQIDILLLQDEQFGGNWDVNDANDNIREHFEKFGWHMTRTGLAPVNARCSYSTGIGLRPEYTDLLLSEIEDITDYDIVCLLPNRSSSENIYNSPEALAMIKEAVDSGLVVAAWCRAVRVLAAADVIDGLEVVGHADWTTVYEDAGATYLGNDHLPVVEGNIVTSVRSRAYRTQMCEAIRGALPPTLMGLHCVPAVPMNTDSVAIAATISDYSGVAGVTMQVDTGTGYFPVTMFDDGLHGDDGAGDSVFAGSVPPVSKGVDVSFYFEILDNDGVTATHPVEAPVEVHTYSVTSCCGFYNEGFTGNANCSDDGMVTLSDITRLIDHVYISKDPLCCGENGNANGSEDGAVTLSDITRLIDHVYITKSPTAECL